MEDLVDQSISVADLEVTLEQPYSYGLSKMYQNMSLIRSK
jgi:hypothetical protein